VGVTVEGIHMGEGRDETGAARWRLCDARDSCGCAPLYEGWGNAVEWQREGDDSENGIRLARSMRVSPTSLLTGTGVSGIGWLMAAQQADLQYTWIPTPTRRPWTGSHDTTEREVGQVEQTGLGSLEFKDGSLIRNSSTCRLGSCQS